MVSFSQKQKVRIGNVFIQLVGHDLHFLASVCTFESDTPSHSCISFSQEIPTELMNKLIVCAFVRAQSRFGYR